MSGFSELSLEPRLQGRELAFATGEHGELSRGFKSYAKGKARGTRAKPGP